MLGNLLDGYIEGNFYVGNNEKIPPEKLELAPFIERIAETKLFLNDDGTPMSKSTLTKMAEIMWQRIKESDTTKSIRRNHTPEEAGIKRYCQNSKTYLCPHVNKTKSDFNEMPLPLMRSDIFFMLWHGLENVTNIIIN